MEPNYYAIIPANVRYDKALKPNAKLLYGEITALAQRDGFCWATNEYFAALYEVDHKTIFDGVHAMVAVQKTELEMMRMSNKKRF